jgi:biotin carboxyl carrier protein
MAGLTRPDGSRSATATVAVRANLAPGLNGATPGLVVQSTTNGQPIVDGAQEEVRLEAARAPRARLRTASGVHDVLLLPLPDARRSAAGIERVEVVVDGWRFEVDLESEDRARLRERATRAKGDRARGGPLELRAIIPGRVVSVDVAHGDTVEAGQRVLVVEAMKMQNELRAPRAGTIGRLAVGAGQTVELGDLLLVVE